MNVGQKILLDRLGCLLIPTLLPLLGLSYLWAFMRLVFPGVSRVGIIKLNGGGNAVMLAETIFQLGSSGVGATLITLKSNRYLVDASGLNSKVRFLNDSSPLALAYSCACFVMRNFGRFSVLVDLEIYSKSSKILTRLLGAPRIHQFVPPNVSLKGSVFIVKHQLDKTKSLPFYYKKYLLNNVFGIHPSPQMDFQPLSGIKPRLSISDYIVIAPTCSEFLRYRMLLTHEWVSLIRSTLMPNIKRIVLLGGGDFDRQYNAKLEIILGQAFPSLEVLDYTDLVHSSDMVSLIQDSLKFYSVDSGLMHLSFTVNVPRIICWGPTAPKTRVWGYGAVNTTNIYIRYNCSPCVDVYEDPPCGGSAPCLRNVLDWS